MGVKICPKCGGKVSESRKTCMHCGYSFEEEKKKQCPDCEEFISIDAELCPICGYEFNTSKKEEAPELPLVEIPEELYNDASNEELKGMEPSMVSISCPNCGSNDVSETDEDEYKCNSCQSSFKYNDGKPIIINNYNTYKISNGSEENLSAYDAKKTISEDDFIRETMISIASKMDTPTDVCDVEYTVTENTTEVYIGTYECHTDLTCTVGYDRKEEYIEVGYKHFSKGERYTLNGAGFVANESGSYKCDIKKTRTVTDWSPFSCSGGGKFTNAATSAGSLIVGYGKVIDGVDDNDLKNIPFPSSPSQSAYKRIKRSCEYDSELSISIPGDHHKDTKAYTTSKMTDMLYIKGPSYTLKYNYQESEYSTSGLAYGNLVLAIEDYPKATEDIVVKAKDYIKKYEKAVIILLIATGILLGLSILFLFLRFDWLWIVAAASAITCFIIDVCACKKHKYFLENAKEEINNQKLENLKANLKKRNYKDLSDDDKKKFKMGNDATVFSIENSRNYHRLNIAYCVLTAILMIISIITFIVHTRQDKYNSKNVYIDIISVEGSGYNQYDSYGINMNSSSNPSELSVTYQIYSKTFPISQMTVVSEFNYNGEYIGGLQSNFNFSLEAGATITRKVTLSDNSSNLYQYLCNTSISKMSISHEITSLYSNGTYIDGGKTSTNNLNKEYTKIPQGNGGNNEYNGYTITYETYGGSYISSKTNQTQLPYSLPTPTREGYEFQGWYYDEYYYEKAYGGDSLNSNVTLYAKWEYDDYENGELTETKKNEYTITYESNGGGSITTVSGVTNLPYSLPTPTREGYNFIGWYYDEYYSEQAYGGDSLNSNVTLYAKFELINYTITYNLGAEEYNDSDNITTIRITDTFTLKPATKTGYTFKGWYLYGEKVEVLSNISSNITLTPQFEIGVYTITFDSQGGSEVLPITQEYNTNLVLPTNVEKTGYQFRGWYYDKEGTKVFKLSKMPSESITLYAKWSINTYSITLDNQTGVVTISGITSGNEYEYNTEITLTATNIPEEYYIVWTRSDGVLSGGDSYTFNVPAKDLTITITKVTPNSIYSIVDSKIYFGSYPQTSVTDETLISSLNTLAGTLPTLSALGNWTDYNYYIKGKIESYMYYQDIDYDSDGDYDYRGVYFTQYRPYYTTESSSTDNSNQADNGYSTGTVYWFKYEPIEWDILTESDGKALIIANLILDSQDYDAVNENNNYELSNIRKWLNDNFYNTAFNDLQKVIIETTIVDNSVASTGKSSNKYACNNTNDKMFLLSEQELITCYTTTTARQALGTDYAKCQGLYVYSTGYSKWWSRSPDNGGAYDAYYVSIDGYIYYSSCVYYAANGIRPACWINL